MEAVRPSKASSHTAKPKPMPPSWALLPVGRFRRSPLPRRPRAALARSPACKTRNWAGLAEDMVGVIADRVLAYDVVDYIRFRAVCRQWRLGSVEPREQDWLDRRFHPRRWRVVKEKRATPGRVRLLNTYPVMGIQVDLPELHGHYQLGPTCDGLLVLLHIDGDQLRLLNPLTRQLTCLPPLTTLLHSGVGLDRETQLDVWGSGNAKDDSAFVLCLNNLGIVGVAKRGDVHWTPLHIGSDRPRVRVSSMFKGPF